MAVWVGQQDQRHDRWAADAGHTELPYEDVPDNRRWAAGLSLESAAWGRS